MNLVNKENMINNVVRDLGVFYLTIEEKEMFYKVVNKLSREVYIRGKKESSDFLKAIEDGNADDAFLLIQNLSWRYPAIRILREIKRIYKLNDDKSKAKQLEELCEFAYKYSISDNPPRIICCDKCGYILTTLDPVCLSCGKLIDE